MTITLSLKLKWWVKPLVWFFKTLNHVSGYKPDVRGLTDFVATHGVRKFINGKGF